MIDNSRYNVATSKEFDEYYGINESRNGYQQPVAPILNIYEQALQKKQ